MSQSPRRRTRSRTLRSNARITLAGLSALLLLGGCAIGPFGSRPATPAPAQFASAPVDAASGAAVQWPDTAWWQGFASAELDGLIAAAREANPDLAIAAARVAQADAAARIAGAPLLPALSADGGVRRARTTSAAGGRARTASSYDAGLAASWELDLWGRNRAALAAAEANALASRFDREAVALTVTASVAGTYFQLLSLRERLAIARANLANAERVLAVVQARFAAGAASALDVAQQRTQIANQRAAIPILEQQERQASNALALLLGRSMQGISIAAQSLRAVRPVPVLAGLPSELLNRRPDLRAAEADLATADANLAAARAALFPTISLTAQGGVLSNTLGTLLSSGNVISIGASILASIFDGGARRGRVALSEAQRVEVVAAYRNAVLRAFADVEDALIATGSRTQRETLLAAALAEARQAFALANAQYQAGAVALVTVLEAQRALFSAEDAYAAARLERLAALVALYRALGGGWSGGVLPPR
ncbi:MAG: efflux transporter outer membrane subunit [Alphaproteobacteria bacterium]|nr:efflux transporter outer membrane subunit [Alphaproteobacteria bacterium]